MEGDGYRHSRENREKCEAENRETMKMMMMRMMKMRRLRWTWTKKWRRSRAVEVVGVDNTLGVGGSSGRGKEVDVWRGGDGMWWKEIDASVPCQEWCLDWIQKKRCGGRWRQGLRVREK